MNKKEKKKFDDIINYFDKCGDFDRVEKIRKALNINANYERLVEISTLQYLMKSVLESRQNFKSKKIFASTSGWTVEYYRDTKKYIEDENFDLKIYFSFVEYDPWS